MDKRSKTLMIILEGSKADMKKDKMMSGEKMPIKTSKEVKKKNSKKGTKKNGKC